METSLQENVTITAKYQYDEIVGAFIQVNDQLIIVRLGMDIDEIKHRVYASCGYEMTANQLMTITRFAREQAERDGHHVCQYLMKKSSGTVALIERGFHAWITPGSPNVLRFSQQLAYDCPPGDLMGISLSEMDNFSLQQLSAIAKSFRTWLKQPSVATVNPEYLVDISYSKAS